MEFYALFPFCFKKYLTLKVKYLIITRYMFLLLCAYPNKNCKARRNKFIARQACNLRQRETKTGKKCLDFDH